MMASGKCPHEHLVAGSRDNGVTFTAKCSECGLVGAKPGHTPHEAVTAFNRARGSRPNIVATNAAMKRVAQPQMTLFALRGGEA